MERRKQILAFITDYIRVHGYAPVIREIGVACGITSTSVVAYHLRQLERMGTITFSGDRSSRTIRLSGARFVVPGDRVQVDVDGFVQHGVFVA